MLLTGVRKIFEFTFRPLQLNSSQRIFIISKMDFISSL